ncbi:MAG: cyclase family protein [Steroidobacteraceae bacterium]
MRSTGLIFCSVLLGILLPLVGRAADQDDLSLWRMYRSTLAVARYVDLTHAFAPGQPVGVGFGQMEVGPARASVTIPGVIDAGDPFTYETLGAGITSYRFPTDQVATQLDPPAHMNSHGATISDLPPTFAVRPLVVVNLAQKVIRDPGYVATVQDVIDWERKHGRIPKGSVVMFRTDWSRRWSDPKRFTARPFPGVSVEALKFLHLQRKILFHGHEPLDTDMTSDFVAETWLLKHNYTQAEGVANLDLVPEAGALVSIGFAKPEGGTGGFARFIAIVPKNWPNGVTIDESPGAPLPEYEEALKRADDGVLRRPR